VKTEGMQQSNRPKSLIDDSEVRVLVESSDGHAVGDLQDEAYGMMAERISALARLLWRMQTRIKQEDHHYQSL
jgi:hypothetical protein